MTIAMNQAWLDEEEVVRITDSEFITVKRDDLQGDFDLRIQVSTPERDDDQATKIMKLMQTNAASMDPELVKMHYVKLAQLWKLEDLAAQVNDYQPQPDPMKQELIRLQIEEQKLKNALAQKQLEDYDSKIYERISRTDENAEGDRTLKKAKAEQALATAAKIAAETDILDQSFLYVQSGKKRLDEAQNQQFKADVEIAKEKEKTYAQKGQEHMKQAYVRTPGKVIAEI